MNRIIQRVYIPLNLCFGIIANNNNLFRGKEKMKIRTYEILKLDINRLAKVDGKKIKVVPLTVAKEEALLNGELIRVQESQMIRVICEYFSGQTIDMSQIIVNVHVPTELKTTGEKMYLQCAENGITVNGNHYKRFASGSGQIRNNTVTFLREDLVEPITEKLMCGLEFCDFGNDYNSAKFNAYFGLGMSHCHLLPDALTPNVCVVDDYEAIRPHDVVNYVTEREVDYIVLPTGDYILSPNDPAFVVENGKATRNSDGSVFVVRHGIKKDITQQHYDEIENSPCLNSFDGQGLMSPEWSAKVSDFLGFGYVASEMIVRCPWVKGLLATVDFKKWFAEHGISEIRDSFGKVRNVADIDVIISKSQFKMHKIYSKKVQGTNVNAWDYHTNCMIENGLHWGIVKPNKPDEHEKTLNYQYIEALDIDGSDIDRLCKRTREYLESLNSGDIREVYKNLIKADADYDDNNNDDTEEHKPRYQVALDANKELINDKYIRSLILQECENKLNAAKLGKIIVRGNYQFCVSDPVAQLEHIAKNHCGMDISVVGVVPAGHVYSNYWLSQVDNTGLVTILRSPLIDRNEIAKRIIINHEEEYFKYLRSGLVLSIHDLTALGCGGCDFDGDLLFSTNDKTVAKGSYNYGTAKPLYYELGDTSLVGEITDNNLALADIRGLNSKVGQISNRAASLYSLLKQYRRNSSEYKKIESEIIALGQIVGQEIDKIKTGIKPTLPLEWQRLQVVWLKGDIYEDDYMLTCEDEAQGIYKHNEFVPDIKPYFLRYNYKYLDDDIRKLRHVANQNSVINFGLKLDELENLCKSGEATEEMQVFYGVYKKAFPVNDSDCVVNRISHTFEKLQLDLQRKITSEGQNMLQSFVSGNDIDANVLVQVNQIYQSYKRFLRIQAKRINANSKDNIKNKILSTAKINESMRKHCRKKMMDICGTNQSMFDSLVAVSKCDNKAIWDIMGDSITTIIRGKN